LAKISHSKGQVPEVRFAHENKAAVRNLYFLVTVQYTQNLTAIPLNFIACKICKIKIAVIYLISNFPFVHHFLSRFDVRYQGINGLFAMFKGFLKRSKDIQLMSFLGEQKIRDSIYSNNL